MQPIISRRDALKIGATTYFTGRPCPHGHVAKRWSANYGCSKCIRSGLREWEKLHPEKSREQDVKWRTNNADAIREHKAAYYIKNKRQALISMARLRARKRGFDFSLSIGDVEWPTHCPALGNKLDYEARGTHNKNSPTLDRLDNTKGYVAGNVRVISRRANGIKSDATAKELQLIADYIARECGV